MGLTPLQTLNYQELADMRRHCKGFLAMIERAMCEYDLTHPERSDRTALERDRFVSKWFSFGPPPRALDLEAPDDLRGHRCL